VRSHPSGLRTIPLGTVLIVAALAGCGAPIADPAFESEEVVAAVACTDGRLCLEVRAPVVGGHEGVGSCVLYGPGDPEDLDPLAESGDLAMRPGRTTVWTVDVNGRFAISQLNPVCEPMIEG
jgi:hypothetical protein